MEQRRLEREGIWDCDQVACLISKDGKLGLAWVIYLALHFLVRFEKGKEFGAVTRSLVSKDGKLGLGNLSCTTCPRG